MLKPGHQSPAGDVLYIMCVLFLLSEGDSCRPRYGFKMRNTITAVTTLRWISHRVCFVIFCFFVMIIFIPLMDNYPLVDITRTCICVFLKSYDHGIALLKRP